MRRELFWAHDSTYRKYLSSIRESRCPIRGLAAKGSQRAVALFYSFDTNVPTNPPTGMPPTALAADDPGDSELLLPTYVDGDDVEPVSELTLGHSKPSFRNGSNPIGDRDTTTTAAPWTFPPPSRPSAGVSNGISNSASTTNHPDAQQGQRLLVLDSANRRRHRLALVWSYAPDWFV